MGNKLSACKRNVLLLGLPGAGKTTLLNKFRFGDALPTTPTFGFSREKFEYRGIKFTAWDIGGDESRNTLSISWRAHVKSVDAVIFIVDATNERARLMDAAALLHQYFAQDAELLRYAKLLVYANKQDLLSGCVELELIKEILNLNGVTKNPHFVKTAAVVNGEGIYEGLDWLCRALADAS